ncbi:MAG: Ribosomal RNA small subunit methyltransferase H [Chlamydiae bacterium]|nr:Ribosomal RNA small subunit methyltransferase H [Chlamydiota bacterium]
MKSHKPVLLEEILSFLEGREVHTVVDGTVGAGGHSQALLEAHPEIEKLVGVDQDPEALAIASETLEPWKDKVVFVQSNFRDLKELVQEFGPIDGILLDVGVSSTQLDQPERGFSLSQDGPLDMRMDPEAFLDAATIINTFSERELGKIFRDYGEERRWRAAAKAIVEGRRKKKIKTTQELAQVLKGVLPWRGRKIHPLTLVFQGLRIRVNEELKVLEEVLPQAVELLQPGGRLCVISFHSLEDRIVKNSFRTMAKEKEVQILTKKPMIASREEIRRNPRSRSAKLRVVERL